jgi:uncharacterized protein (TIGR03067 family)
MKSTKICLAVLVTAGTLCSSARSDDGGSMRGSWTLLSAEEAGWQMSPDLAGVTMLEVQGGRYVMTTGGQVTAIGAIALRSGWPKQINLVPLSGPDAGQVYEGIYDITGDVQTVSFASPGDPRPADFSTFPGSGRSLYVWLRAQRPMGGPLRPMPGENF